MKQHTILLPGKALPAIVAAFLLASTAAQGQITYSQYFNNGTGASGDKTAAVYNWAGSIGTAGANITNTANVGVS